MKRWGWLEWFVLILFLANGILLLPGAQPLRFGIRALPYVASLGSMIWLAGRKTPIAPGAMAMQAVIVLLVLNLLQPATQWKAGIAQVVLQAAIVCPIFWAVGTIRDESHLMRVLWLVFGCSAIGAAVGILQIYYPERFLPAEFSSGVGANWVSSMTFVGPGGKLLVRPPGLSDLPGGAATAGSLTAILGLAFSALRTTSLWLRMVCLGAAAAGISVLYLTQVRSLTVMTVLALFALVFFAWRQGQIWDRGWLAMAAIGVVLGAFTWAVRVGGDGVRERFQTLDSSRVADTVSQSRGYFWKYTFGEGLGEFPLGAGLGRWGMANTYFSDARRADSSTLWAEIQPTGWLYDGGVPLWMAYGSGLFLSLLFLFRMALSRRYGDGLPLAAALIFCLNAIVVGASLSGPAFNTTMGLQYWLLTALVYGAARSA